MKKFLTIGAGLGIIVLFVVAVLQGSMRPIPGAAAGQSASAILAMHNTASAQPLVPGTISVSPLTAPVSRRATISPVVKTPSTALSRPFSIIPAALPVPVNTPPITSPPSPPTPTPWFGIQFPIPNYPGYGQGGGGGTANIPAVTPPAPAVDSVPPVIAASPTVVSEATSSLGAYVAFTSPTASDDVSGAVATACTPASGSLFALGTTTVTCSATDAASNTATSSFAVRVVDTTVPSIATSSTIVAEATSSLGAYVSYTTPTSTDLVSGALTPTCASSSGSLFALGTTTVACSVADAAGNTATSSFDIIIVDTTKPTIASSTNVTAEATSSLGAYVNYTVPTSTDTVSGSLTTSCTASSSSLFALGTTTVACSASDAAGNTATSSFDVVVVDTTAPVIASTTDLFVVATSSNSTGATVTYTAPTATDLVSGSFAATCTLSSGSLFAVGTTTVACSATDAAGNTATSTFDVGVTVPAPSGPAPGTSFTFAASQTDESYLCDYGFASCFQGTTTAPLDTQTFDLGAGSSTLQGGALTSITIALDPTYAAAIPPFPWGISINCFTQSSYIAANHCTDWAPTTNYFITAQATSTQDNTHWTAYFTPITFNPSYFYQLMIDDNINGIPTFGSQVLSKPYFILNGVTQ